MWKLASSSCARKHIECQMVNIKTDTQGEISSACFVSVLRDVTSDGDRYQLSALNSSSLCLMCVLVTSSECSWNQISVVIDMASEVMPLLLRHYKGLDGDCHSGMALGAVRKPQAGNLMRLKLSYTHSIFPQHDVGTKGFKWKEGGAWYFAGYRYLIQPYYGFSGVNGCFNTSSFWLPEVYFHSLSKFLPHLPLQPQHLHAVCTR